MIFPFLNTFDNNTSLFLTNEGNRNDLKLLRNFKRTKKKNNTKKF